MKKRNKTIFKILGIVLLLLVITQIVPENLQARINTSYGDNSVSYDDDLDAKIKNSIVLDYMGGFIYAVGSLVKSLASSILGVFSSGKVFPWADRIIFNTIPILDINFIYPDNNSLLSDATGIGKVIRNVYFTGLSIALGFLGIIISVMAIKLAISSIASEKAKYKEAIVKWLTAIILLFGMHFVLSFVFYLNESMVELAGQILEKNVSEYGDQIQEKISETLNKNKYKVVDNFIKRNEKDIKNAEWGVDDEAKGYMDTIKNNSDLSYSLLVNATVREYVISNTSGNSEHNGIGDKILGFFRTVGDKTLNTISLGNWDSGPKRDLEFLAWCVTTIQPGGDVYSTVEMKKGDISWVSEEFKNEEGAPLYKVLYKYAADIYSGKDLNDDGDNNIIGDLGEFFETSAWYVDVEGGGWSPSKISITAAILFTMFVFQSIMFFMSYVRRMFYVVILSVIAPVVIVYDFFAKSVSL